MTARGVTLASKLARLFYVPRLFPSEGVLLISASSAAGKNGGPHEVGLKKWLVSALLPERVVRACKYTSRPVPAGGRDGGGRRVLLRTAWGAALYSRIAAVDAHESGVSCIPMRRPRVPLDCRCGGGERPHSARCNATLGINPRALTGGEPRVEPPRSGAMTTVPEGTTSVAVRVLVLARTRHSAGCTVARSWWRTCYINLLRYIYGVVNGQLMALLSLPGHSLLSDVL